jgi:hypothetical protein
LPTPGRGHTLTQGRAVAAGHTQVECSGDGVEGWQLQAVVKGAAPFQPGLVQACGHAGTFVKGTFGVDIDWCAEAGLQLISAIDD